MDDSMKPEFDRIHSEFDPFRKHFDRKKARQAPQVARFASLCSLSASMFRKPRDVNDLHDTNFDTGGNNLPG